ncbi:methyl-accepting chemotaxis protein [Pseudomonas sp.]|uniref:methyl-accepting chemotaxis protein n=1 Tax=Pseudomonas sp. TaxID=306 RepID=UPI00299E855E|nr:methyl-accepting chemotaxis protein [Pseudomonas sp.]MDX1368649.1 methyl-accepting chemotaxis protein [Pseudomonas sp.]
MDNNVLRFNIGSKLIMAFALLILGFGGLLFFTLERFVSLQKNEELQFRQNYERLSAAKELRINIAAQRSDLLLAIDEGTPEELDVREAEIRRHSEENDLQVKRLQLAASDDAEVGDILEQLLAVRSLAAKTREQQLQLIRSSQLEQARQLSSGIQQERIDRIHELGLQLAKLTDRRTAEALVHSRQALQTLRERILNLSLLLVVASAVLAWLLSRHIARPLARLTGWAERIGRGEIPQEVIASTRQDEVGRLAQAFGAMSQYLRELVQEMNEGISVLASSSEEILAATSQVASSTQETATAISEIATTVEEVKQTAVLAGSKSQAVAESTERTRQVALGGRQAVEEALAGMQQIREQMQAVAESIMRLGEQSQAIGEIVASVGDLAEQSNLLGVNASIEAVKAGETGKGFSVVAQEVKALAEQSKQATAQVRGILGEIQKAMTRAVLLAEQGGKTVEAGYLRAQTSGEAIRSLSGSIETSSEMALQIAATSQQQLIGMDQVASAMANIRQASQDNVGGTRQVDLAARNLHQLGLKLKGLAARFKL